MLRKKPLTRAQRGWPTETSWPICANLRSNTSSAGTVTASHRPCFASFKPICSKHLLVDSNENSSLLASDSTYIGSPVPSFRERNSAQNCNHLRNLQQSENVPTKKHTKTRTHTPHSFSHVHFPCRVLEDLRQDGRVFDRKRRLNRRSASKLFVEKALLLLYLAKTNSCETAWRCEARLNNKRNRRFANAIVQARHCDTNVASRAVDTGRHDGRLIVAFVVWF